MAVATPVGSDAEDDSPRLWDIHVIPIGQTIDQYLAQRGDQEARARAEAAISGQLNQPFPQIFNVVESLAPIALDTNIYPAAPNPLADIGHTLESFDDFPATDEDVAVLVYLVDQLDDQQKKYLTIEQKVAILALVYDHHSPLTLKTLRILATNEKGFPFPDPAPLGDALGIGSVIETMMQPMLDVILAGALTRLQLEAIIKQLVAGFAEAFNLTQVPTVEIVNMSDYGGFDFATNTLTLSEEIIPTIGGDIGQETAGLLKLLSTIAHEMAHAWQTNLMDRLTGGGLLDTDPLYPQALLFLASANYNWLILGKSSENPDYYEIWLENHAFTFEKNFAIQFFSDLRFYFNIEVTYEVLDGGFMEITSAARSEHDLLMGDPGHDSDMDLAEIVH